MSYDLYDVYYFSLIFWHFAAIQTQQVAKRSNFIKLSWKYPGFVGYLLSTLWFFPIMPAELIIEKEEEIWEAISAELGLGLRLLLWPFLAFRSSSQKKEQKGRKKLWEKSGFSKNRFRDACLKHKGRGKRAWNSSGENVVPFWSFLDLSLIKGTQNFLQKLRYLKRS